MLCFLCLCMYLSTILCLKFVFKTNKPWMLVLCGWMRMMCEWLVMYVVIKYLSVSLFWVSKLGMMVDVEYEDYEIIKFPYFYELLPSFVDPKSKLVKLPTFTFSDYGFPASFQGTSCDEPRWTLATETEECTAMLLHCELWVYVSFFCEEIICFSSAFWAE